MSGATFIITDFMLSHILHFDLNSMSEYLSYTNGQFQEILQHSTVVLSSSSSSTTSNEEQKNKLRSIILLTYKTKLIEMIQSLWKVYRQSGIDQFNIDPHIRILDRHVWPKEIQLLMNELHTLLFGTRTNTFSPFTMRYPRNAHTYLTFIDSCIHALQKKHDDYQNMLTADIYDIPDYENQFQERINRFIQQQLIPIKIQIDCHIELIYLEYKDELYRRQLASIILNDGQITLIEEFCLLKAEGEEMKSKINLYKYMQLHSPSENFINRIPSLLNCTRNPNLHQELRQQYHLFTEKIESDTFDHYIESLEMRQEDIQLECNQTRNRFWQDHRALPNQQRNLTLIRHAIDQRLSNITNRLTCIEKYKKRFLQI